MYELLQAIASLSVVHHYGRLSEDEPLLDSGVLGREEEERKGGGRAWLRRLFRSAREV